MVAYLAIVTDISCKISLHEFLDIPAAASNHLYSLSLEHILGALPHVACKHNLHSHLPQYRSNTALASATFRRSHLAHASNLVINNIENSIICAMAEMVIHTSVSCRYSYLHLYLKLAQSLNRNRKYMRKDTDFCYFCKTKKSFI